MAVALIATAALYVLPAGTDLIAPFWFVAILWTIRTSLLQTLGRGLRHGDWSAFQFYECPPNQHEYDRATQSNAYVDLYIQAQHEALPVRPI